MRLILSFIAISLVLLSCKSSGKKAPIDCSKTHAIKLGRILLSLPACYKIYRPDTIMHESLFFILKGHSIKLQGLAGLGLTSLDATISIKNDKSINLYSDTIGNILRQIGYYKKGEKYGMIVNIINFKDRITLFKDMLKGEKHINNELANEQFSLLLNAGTEYEGTDDIYLSKEDVDILITAFKKSKIF
jgi:hypothetical protein